MLDEYTYGKLNECVHCGFCLPYCPTYRILGVEADSPRGRIRLMKAYADGEVTISEGLLEHISLCLVCRNCETVCPSGVKFGWAMDMTREKIEENKRRSLGERTSRRLFFSAFESLWRFRLAMRFLGIYSRQPFTSIGKRMGLDSFLRIADSGVMRSSKGFVKEGRVFRAEGETRFRVAFLVGCVMSTIFADIDRATISVLTRNGCEVHLPSGQTCCGALQVHEGERKRAMKLAKRNIDAFLRGRKLDAIIVNSAGCGAQMKEYGELLRDDKEYSERAQKFSIIVRDFAEFVGSIEMKRPQPLPMKVTYQDPCHLVHGQGVKKQPRDVLAQIPKLKLVEMDDPEQCCGAAGIYSAIQPEMAEKILLRKMEAVERTGAEAVIASNPPCLLHYGMGIKKYGKNLKVLHVAEVLELCYARPNDS